MTLSLAREFSAPKLSWQHCLAAALFAILALFLSTRDNRFPSSYHPDESSKTRQVLDGDYNFHHPLLLLDTARLVMAVARVSPEEESVTIAGRWASAGFTSAAIFALVLAATLMGGQAAGIFAGCLLVANHQLFELAHYFKEDSSALMGVACFFLALLAYDRAPSAARSIILGVALGLAISAKYLCALVTPLAFLLIGLRRGDTRPWRDAILCAAAALAVATTINLPMLSQLEKSSGGFERELEFAVHGHQGIGRDVPHGVYWKVFIDSTMPVRGMPAAGLLLAACYASLVLRRREVRASEWMLALYPIAFALLLSFFPKTHHRYFLPATGLLLVLAAVGAAAILRIAWNGRLVFRPGAAALAAGAVILGAAMAVQLPIYVKYYRGFSRDGRSEMADYLRTHVPAGTIIVQDRRVDLDALKLPYDFRGRFFAAELGPLARLRAQGIRYVAVAEGDYGRYLGVSMKPSKEAARTFRAYRKFYQRLFARGKKVFECPAGTIQYLQPHITLYRLPAQR